LFHNETFTLLHSIAEVLHEHQEPDSSLVADIVCITVDSISTNDDIYISRRHRLYFGYLILSSFLF